MVRRILFALLLLFLVGLALVYMAGRGFFGSTDGPGELRAGPRPAAVQGAIAAAQGAGARGVGASAARQILFGDFHVHTTLSADAFLMSLPSAGGVGARPPADACDFARYCSALDFWSINDHAEGLSPRAWDVTVEAIRACNDMAGDPANPDTVAYLGWEWSQIGRTAEEHYGHKNVVIRGLEDDEIPARPIAAGGRAAGLRANPPPVLGRGLFALFGSSRTHDLMAFVDEVTRADLCPAEVDTRELPDDCFEVAETPAELFRKLNEWDLDSIVIPHGTTWGFYTPTGSTWDKQLRGALHDPERQTLLEIYSGHGDSEVYRSWRAVERGADGEARCPDPTPEYEPSCYRAGEIIRGRCLAQGVDAEECEARAVETRRLAALAGGQAHLVVRGEEVAEWLDAGQCRDCREPAFNYRPGGSAQYILALGDFEEDPEDPRRFRMGFISSSDNHTARPGTGYKEVERTQMTESVRGSQPPPRPRGLLGRFLARPPEEPLAEPLPFDPDEPIPGFQFTELERQGSFFLTGGLVAVHSEGRDRDAIWRALERKEVYGTTGPRILLWFDLINPPGSRGATLPMGGEIAMREAPVFQVRAVGSFEQDPGCPDHSLDALGAEAVEHLCRGACYNPSDERRRITRLEVVRIRPQVSPDEDVAELIDDPWQVVECDESPEGCVGTFVDADFEATGRDTVYYARVFETPAPAINAAGAACEYDDAGNCIRARLCEGDDDCLAEHEPRAWSSPIYVDFDPHLEGPPGID